MKDLEIVVTRSQCDGGHGSHQSGLRDMFDITVNGSPVFASACNDTPEHVGVMVASYIRANATHDEPVLETPRNRTPCYCDSAFHPQGH